MIWKVDKGERTSFLAGTAHFFPHSFEHALNACLETVKTVMFEGPLDEGSMEKVLKAGMGARKESHLYTLLDGNALARLRSSLMGKAGVSHLLVFRPLRERDPLYAMVEGMKPWLAFFTLWTAFLTQKGWNHSVDLEAYRLAAARQKYIVFLETIEEQIEVLESLSLERIVLFLTNAEHWDRYAQAYVQRYGAGDLDGLLSLATGFPSRTSAVIEGRDRALFQRMLPFLEEGKAVAFVGAPHVRGISPMLLSEGFRVTHAQF